METVFVDLIWASLLWVVLVSWATTLKEFVESAALVWFVGVPGVVLLGAGGSFFTLSALVRCANYVVQSAS